MRYLFLLLVVTASASALSVSPAFYETAYHLGVDSYTLTVTNDEHRSLTITLSPTGPLTELITIQDTVTLAPGTSSRVHVTVRMPSSTQPGTLESGILVEAKPVSAGTVAASSAVLHVIRVTTPRNGTFIAGELLSSAGIVNSPAYLTLSLTNTGTEPVNVSGVIRIDDEQFPTDTVYLAPGESKSLVVRWNPEKIGVYTASALVKFADKEALFTSGLVVGKLSVGIRSIDIGEFRLGELFRVSVVSENEWADPLPATATIEVVQNNRTIASSSSTRVQLLPLQATAIPVFLESRDMAPGPAELLVNIQYADRTSTASFPVIVAVDSLRLARETKTSPYAMLAIIVVLALIVYLLRTFINRKRIM